MSTQKQKNKEQVRSAVTVAFTAHGWDDYEHWKTADSDIFDKIDTLIKECLRTPFKGTGKPESLSMYSYDSARPVTGGVLKPENKLSLDDYNNLMICEINMYITNLTC